jgi:hypothetical protein
MNKIMETLQLNINEYIETKLCKYQNEETEQQLQNIRKDMFNYKINFQKMLNKGLINEQQFEYIKNHWFHCFDILETFLKECNTELFISYKNIPKMMKRLYNSYTQNEQFEILTNKNIKIIVGDNMTINNQIHYSCMFISTNNEDNNLNYSFYIPFHNCNYKENQIFEFADLDKNIRLFKGSMIQIQMYNLQSLAKKINLISKNPNFYQLDLDYLQLQDDPTIKCFMEKNHSIQLAEKNTKIKQLQKIIEEKCDTIEQLNAELTKQKNNFANLNKERVKNNEYHKIKMDELQFVINKKTEEQQQLIEKHSLNIENLKQQYQNENYECVNSLKEKIIRLQTELNQKNIANKKLTIQLNDLNELYENLQEKMI